MRRRDTVRLRGEILEGWSVLAEGHPFTRDTKYALSVSFFVPRFYDQGRSEGSESPSDSRISQVRVGRDESGAIGRPDVARDRPATKKKVMRNRGGYIIRNATFFSDGRDVITAPCEPSRITNFEGRDDDRDKKTSPPDDWHVGAYIPPPTWRGDS